MESESQKQTVSLVKNAEGDSINFYGTTGYGFVEVSCDKYLGGQKEKVFHRIKGDLSTLRLLMSDYFVDGVMPGQIIVKEFLESQVPDGIKKEYYHKKKPYAEAVLEFVKRDNKTGKEIIVSGERVVRVTEFISLPDSINISTLTVEYTSPK